MRFLSRFALVLLMMVTAARAAPPFRFERLGGVFVARSGGTTFSVSGRDVMLHSAGSTLRIELLGAKPGTGKGESEARINFIQGNDPKHWRIGVPSFARVRFKEIYPGVAVVYYGNRGRLEFDFVVALGADWRRISLAFPRQQRVLLDANGDVILPQPGSVQEIRIRKPAVYQETSQGRRIVDGRFVLKGRNRLGFEVSGNDPRATLVIDPVVSFATLLGGDDTDQGNGIAVDSAGNAYVAGVTTSGLFPTLNATLPSHGGVSLSTNAGSSWRLANQGLANPYVQAVVVDPSGVVYAGTFGGVFKSTDSGSTWTPASTGITSLFVNCLALDPQNPRTLYAGTRIQTGGGVFKSTDGGASWASSGLPGKDLQVVLVHPTLTGVVFASEGSPDFPSGTLYRSTDGGANWTAATGTGAVRALAVDPQTTTTMYAAFASSTRPGVAKSTDAGLTWQALSASVNLLALAIDPRTPTTIYGGGAKSTDAGISWTSLQTPCSGLTVRTLAVDPSAPSTLYIGCPSGVAKSTDGGATWTLASQGLGSLNVYALALDPRNSALIYAGTRTLSDAFVTKYDPAGNLVYSTYLGGAGNDGAMGIAVDAAGNAYVTGFTASADFPTSPGAPQSSIGRGGSGIRDAFVTKLNASGALVYSTFLGGAADDIGNGIAVDSSGNAAVTGITVSADFPTRNALQSSLRGTTDAFVAKLNAAGSAWIYSTYLGGDDTEVGKGIAVDGQGNAYVTGLTASLNLPLLNPLQSTRGGGYVAKLDLAGTLIYSTYFGTSSTFALNAIAVDANGSAYVTGGTFFGEFPLVNPVQTTGRAILSKLSPDGSSLVYSTRFGGSTSIGFGVAVDPLGAAYVTGVDSSAELPLVDAFQITVRGPADAFAVKVDPSGSRVVYSSYLGGSPWDQGSAIAVDSQGTAYITGFAQPMSAGAVTFPATAGAAQGAYGGGGYDGFVAKILGTPGSVPTLSSPAVRAVIPATGGASSLAQNPPGSLASIYGSDLASASLGAALVPLPTNLLGTSVQINGLTVPLLYVSPTQVNVQIPWELAGQTQASLTLSNSGGTSAPVTVRLNSVNPAIFTLYNAQGQSNAAVLIAGTGGVVAAPVGFLPGSRPVKRGEFIEIYCGGFGAVTNTPPTGTAGQSSPLSMTTATPTVTFVGAGTNAPATVTFSGLAPGLVGVYQVNVQVPANAPTGDSIGVYITIGGVLGGALLAVQ